MIIKHEKLESMQAYPQVFPFETNDEDALCKCMECQVQLEDADDDYCNDCYLALFVSEGI